MMSLAVAIALICSPSIPLSPGLMEPIPLPSHIHYELLLQLLERQTSQAVRQHPRQQDQLHELIVTLRKALSQQKYLEQSCQQAQIPIDFRWSLNENGAPATPADMPHSA